MKKFKTLGLSILLVMTMFLFSGCKDRPHDYGQCPAPNQNIACEDAKCSNCCGDGIEVGTCPDTVSHYCLVPGKEEEEKAKSCPKCDNGEYWTDPYGCNCDENKDKAECNCDDKKNPCPDKRVCCNKKCCPTGYKCLSGNCVQCESDADCPTGQKCDLETHKCVLPDCNDNTDCDSGLCCRNKCCPPGYKCDASGQCIECTTDAECVAAHGAGWKCDLTTNRCERTICTGDADCASGSCNIKTGQCCAAGYTYMSDTEQCERRCDTNGQCTGAGEICCSLTGTCRTAANCVCSSARPCPNSRVCCSGTCCAVGQKCDATKGCVDCTTDAECVTAHGTGWKCDLTTNTCVTDTCTVRCPNGACCDNGFCNSAGDCVPCTGSNYRAAAYNCLRCGNGVCSCASNTTSITGYCCPNGGEAPMLGACCTDGRPPYQPPTGWANNVTDIRIQGCCLDGGERAYAKNSDGTCSSVDCSTNTNYHVDPRTGRCVFGDSSN